MQGESRIRMASQSFLMNRVNSTTGEKAVPNTKLCYEEKSVGSTSFYKCECCPFMAFAEDDIKYHLFTVHPELAKTIGLADVKIQCPGCSEMFDAENPLRTHLREHHKMGIRDVRKMVKSLIQIALKNVKTEVSNDNSAAVPTQADSTNDDEVIEIVPDLVQSNVTVAGGVTVISVDELQKMSAVNFQEVDPKEVIQEASINIVYSEEETALPTIEETIQNPTPDLISSIETSNLIDSSYTSINYETDDAFIQNQYVKPSQQNAAKEGTKCKFTDCCVRLVSPEKMTYHINCHQQGKLQCPECKRFYTYIKELHTHLWKQHEIDMELHSCNICNYKTYSLSRLKNIHCKIHETVKSVPCPTCGKLFKNYQQMSTHKVLHSITSHNCAVCLKSFVTERRLRIHIETVHEKRKPFKCGECDFTTARKCSLQLHSRTHTGETHKCQQCDFSAIDPSSLRRHKQLHSEQKKYNCKHCSYTSIQSQCFLKHMLNQHADIKSDDVFACPYCKYVTVNRGKLLSHMVIHKGKEELQHFVIDLNMKQQQNWNTPNEEQPKIWNTPTENEPVATWSKDGPSKTTWNNLPQNESTNSWNINENEQQTLKTDSLNTQEVKSNDGNENPTNLTVPIEVDDCDSEQDPSNYPVNYSYINNPGISQEKGYLLPELSTDYNKDDNNSDYIISENSSDTLNDRHQYFSHPIDNVRNVHNTNLREFLGNTATMSNNIVQNPITNDTSNNFVNNNMSTSIMNNLPIHLPPNPRLYIRRNLTLTPSDKIPLPVPKATGPIITQSQILPVPSTSNSPISYTITSQPNHINDNEGAPKKKAKISVKSNLILKGPDQINMFETEQNMVFARLQNNERLNMSSPVTFNNLITTCMQLPPEPVLSSNSEDSLNTIPPYTPEPMMSDPTIVPVKDNRLFTFNKQIDLNSINMLSQHVMPLNKMSIICGNPSFIKLESKQNIQSPSLERMCSTDMMKVQEMSDVYCKSSPLPEELQKNVNEIKNEIKPDTFYNVPVKSSRSSPSVIDRHILDTIIGVNEIYGTHLDLSLPLQEITDEDPLPDIIEIDDNSEDNKIIPQRYNLNYPMDYIHNDFYFLESELNQPCSSGKTIPPEPSESNKIPNEVQHQNESKDGGSFPDNQITNYENFIHGRKDPMMNTSVRPATNKINVKNIELMKN